MKNYLIILCVLALIFVVLATDYCGINCTFNMGKNGKCRGHIVGQGKCEVNHIGCKNTEFQKTCKDPERLDLDSSMKQLFVDKHNEKRNIIAGGGVAKFGRACRMGTMQWDDNLAELAAKWNHFCEPGHDRCHNTDVYQASGQNSFHNFSINNFVPLHLNEQIGYAVDGWYSEVRDTEPSHINAYPTFTPRPVGHFTVMLGESNIRVGCGVATFYNDIPFMGKMVRSKYILVTCNYARTNVFDVPVFTNCTEAASKCTDKNRQFPNLCSISEKYDVNEYIPVKK